MYAFALTGRGHLSVSYPRAAALGWGLLSLRDASYPFFYYLWDES